MLLSEATDILFELIITSDIRDGIKDVKQNNVNSMTVTFANGEKATLVIGLTKHGFPFPVQDVELTS